MANVLYPKGKEGFLDGTIDLDTNDIRVALLRSYTYNSAHQFLSDISGAGATIVARLAAGMTSKVVTNGIFDAADATLSAVAAGAACNNCVIYQYNAADSSAKLIAFIDTATNLPVTPNGGDITVAWDNGSNKIFAL